MNSKQYACFASRNTRPVETRSRLLTCDKQTPDTRSWEQVKPIDHSNIQTTLTIFIIKSLVQYKCTYIAVGQQHTYSRISFASYLQVVGQFIPIQIYIHLFTRIVSYLHFKQQVSYILIIGSSYLKEKSLHWLAYQLMFLLAGSLSFHLYLGHGYINKAHTNNLTPSIGQCLLTPIEYP